MERTSTGMELKVSNGRITNVDVEILRNGTCKIIFEVTHDGFVLCEASKLSLDDEFMKYEPWTYEERRFKEFLEKAIKSGLKDFYRPIYDPSFDKDENICYVSGAKPAVRKSYNWWEENAKRLCPERGSRLGTKNEYIAFVGILIKKLLKAGWSMIDAWNAVCNHPRELGHYWNSPNAKHDLELTGSREICGFYDLANTFKYLSEDEDADADGFWFGSGAYNFAADCYALANIMHFEKYNIDRRNDWFNAVGWIVLEK